MSRSKLFWLAQVLALAVLFTGCAKKASDEIGFGAFDKNVYRNPYFGLTVTLPADWSIQSQDALGQLMQQGGKLLTGDDKNMQAVVKASELQTVNLFAVFQYAKGTPVPFNPSIIALAEKVRELPGIKSGKDYLYHAKQFLESGQIKFNFPKEIYSQKLGGVDFDVMESEMPAREMVVKQKYYATIIKGYALSVIISYAADKESAELQKILDSVTIK